MKNPPSKNYLFRTLGCKANLYDSQLIEAELQKKGWKSATLEDEQKGDVDLCFVNSCTVTDEADRQSRKLAARFSKKNPKAKVVMTGCGAEVQPERLARSPGIHYVVGNQNKPDLVTLVLQALEKDSVSPLEEARVARVLGGVTDYSKLISEHPLDREWPAPIVSHEKPSVGLEGDSRRARSFIKIQEGCNHFCTYCIIPYGRGPSRSFEISSVVDQVRGLVSQGVKEVVLTGTNIGDFGGDLEITPELASRGYKPGDSLFEILLEEILEKTDLSRIRLSSLDPVEITPKILDLMRQSPRICSHFHVSLQSPHPRILRLMKRKYGEGEVIETLHRLQDLPAPVGGVFVGMDLITGFPGESDADFEDTLRRLESLPFSRLHVFPYSEREGTPATRIPGSVPKEVRAARTRILNELSMARMKSHYEQALRDSIDSSRPIDRILIDSDREGVVSGYSSNYLSVQIAKGTSVNSLIRNLERNQEVSVIPSYVVVDEQKLDVYLSSQA